MRYKVDGLTNECLNFRYLERLLKSFCSKIRVFTKLY